MHPRLDYFYVVEGDRMADFQLAVQGFAQGMLDQHLAVRVEIADGADQEQNGRPYQALIAFHRINRQPVDIAVLIYFRLEADTFIIIEGSGNGHIAFRAIFLVNLLQRRSFFYLVRSARLHIL